MTPAFKITADGADITAAIADRLITLAVNDAAGMDSDTVEIAIDDRGGKVEIPRTGATLEIRMGYRETGLSGMGAFVVDEVSLTGPPAAMLIRAHAADFMEKLKKPKTRPWDNVTLGDIVSSIAKEHGYSPLCSAALSGVQPGHIDQVDESDIHFLTRLAKDRGAVAKPADGKLLFVTKGELKSASGKSLPSVTLHRTQISSYEAVIAERGKYPSVTARWHDRESAEESKVTVGEGEPAYTIGRRYPDRASAESAAKARLAAFTSGAATLRIRCPGDTGLMAESKLVITGTRRGVDGEWVMSRVAHRIDNIGYSCDIEAEQGDKR